jgi:hypothetical protein
MTRAVARLLTLAAGDVVQLAPDCTNPALAACFMVVEEVRDWGVTGYIPSCNGRIYYREANGRFHRIGAAEWLVKDSS